jgi:type IV pilus assembly protein PilY1
MGLSVWKLGDPVHSTPTIVSQPRESYDFIYGDPGYLNFFKRWKNRRHVAYVGANDGMLHAFNGGFYNRGDDPSTPVQEHGWFSNTPTSDGRGQELGDELWGFIPYELLPHLRWLAQADYTHVYYVDLKPKVTDVRIFDPEPACAGNPLAATCIHPNGWGTILIGGFRMGGSCGACGAGGAPTMTVSIGGTNRNFYTAYFALDITDPDAEPKLLWSFSDSGMGLSTSYPAVVRMNPPGQKTCPLTGPCDDVWIAVFGSGATGYDGRIGQAGKFYAVDIKVGPRMGTGVGASNVFMAFPIKSSSGGDLNTFVGDLVSIDRDLDYRADAVYGGSVIDDGSLPWRGRMYRLTSGGCIAAPCSTSTWGYNLSGSRVPTEVLDDFSPYPSGTAIQAGPMVAAPGLAVDDANKLWVFFGTGRFFGNVDKTNSESQRLYGVKDSVLSGLCTEASISGCKVSQLVNVSDVAVCVVCATGTNQVTSTALSTVTKIQGTDPTTTLQGLVQSKDGWFTNLTTTRERSITSPTVLGGIVFYPTYVPQDDLCISAGDGYLYGLFYQTGSAMSTPVLGTYASGSSTMANAKVAIGQGTGLLSVMAVHIGAQGSGAGGTGAGGGGCQAGITGIMQSSAGLTNTICTNPGSVTSRYTAWINLRE